MRSILLLFAVFATTDATNVACESTEFCESTLRNGSKCVEGFCDNPFQYGCLQSLQIPGYEDRLRICNSEDPPDASDKGLCRNSKGLDYKEVRLMSQNWESPFFLAWIAQIFLSELLDVPVTIETGKADKNVNFYDPASRFQYGVGNDFEGLERASDLGGDCLRVKNLGGQYKSCGHAILEVWSGYEEKFQDMITRGKLEPPSSVGAIGEEKWFVPMYTARKDPSLISYHGLTGLENRKKLAERFLRPTTWGDYCNEVSDDGCSSGLGSAQRPPESEAEGKKFFADGLFTGHFRMTEDNNCTASPTTCTGHFVDYPCGWKRFFAQQIHHLDIGLKSNGDEEAGGYNYGEMVQIWHAANWTQADIIGLWWRPESLYQQFQGTEFEFQEINLPNPNAACVNNRISSGAFCGGELDTIDFFGSSLGTCDIPPTSLNKVLSTGLYALVDSEPIEAKRSPAYDVLNRLTVDTYELEKIFQYWLSSSNIDKYGYEPRDAVCRWFGENFDVLRKRLMPRSYPRVVEETKSREGAGIIAVVFGAIAVTATVMSTIQTYRKRQKRAFVFAQIEFVFCILFGLLLVSISAINTALPPNNTSCIASVWLLNVGYTFELVPLIVKIAAINKLMQAAKKMKRIRLSKRYLYSVVALLACLVIAYLIIWTAVDRPKRVGVFKIEENDDDDDDDDVTTITASYTCRSLKQVWGFLSVGYQALLLLCGSLLAFMTRKTKNDINETSTVAFLIYWNFVCVLLRALLVCIESNIGTNVWNVSLSLILSIDVIAANIIYFVPKFLETNNMRASQNKRFSVQTMGWRSPAASSFHHSGRDQSGSGQDWRDQENSLGLAPFSLHEDHCRSSGKNSAQSSIAESHRESGKGSARFSIPEGNCDSEVFEVTSAAYKIPEGSDRYADTEILNSGTDDSGGMRSVHFTASDKEEEDSDDDKDNDDGEEEEEECIDFGEADAEKLEILHYLGDDDEEMNE